MTSTERHYTYYRPAILVLLSRQPSHGYELVGRLRDLGFDSRLASSLYGVVRDMEDEGLITSFWELAGTGGPPRRVYSPTDEGLAYLRTGGIPLVQRQYDALGNLLAMFRSRPKETP